MQQKERYMYPTSLVTDSKNIWGFYAILFALHKILKYFYTSNEIDTYFTMKGEKAKMLSAKSASNANRSFNIKSHPIDQKQIYCKLFLL